jgi:hypothetical protein
MSIECIDTCDSLTGSDACMLCACTVKEKAGNANQKVGILWIRHRALDNVWGSWVVPRERSLSVAPYILHGAP